MAFRRTRKSNDGHTWLSVALSFAGSVAGFMLACAASISEEISPKIMTMTLFVLFVLALGFSLHNLVFPREWEVVLEEADIRWGASSDPERQRRLSISTLKRVIHDKGDNQLLADTGGFRLIPIADYVLRKSEDLTALVEYLRQKIPSLPID